MTLATAISVTPPTNSPYRFYRKQIGEERYDAWARESATQTFSDAAGQFECGERGAIAWNHLPWDTEQFGMSAGRIDLVTASSAATANTLIQFALGDCKWNQVRHLICRIDAASLMLARALTACEFELIDGIQMFSHSLGAGPCDVPAGTRLAKPTDADLVASIARRSFIHDRFHNDRALTPETADRVNETWARNSVLGKAADAVFLADEAAFVTCKIDQNTALGLRFASIPLVATDAGQRGKGSARLATEAALAWCRRHKVDIVEVGTQLSNIPAARLYQSAGFRTTNVSLTYRALL